VGVVGGRVRLDLPYEEDARAEVDMNVVATDVGTLVEVQGTAEGATFSRRTLDAMMDSALAGIETLTALQRQALATPLPTRPAPAVEPRKPSPVPKTRQAAKS
jgi:ribonuclease PH